MTNDETAAALNEMRHLGCSDWQFINDTRGGGFVSWLAMMKRIYALAPETARMVVGHKELLDALKEISLLVNAGAMNQFHGEPWIDRMRAAIAKAEEKL